MSIQIENKIVGSGLAIIQEAVRRSLNKDKFISEIELMDRLGLNDHKPIFNFVMSDLHKDGIVVCKEKGYSSSSDTVRWYKLSNLSN